jgi:thioredoxin-related protein
MLTLSFAFAQKNTEVNWLSSQELQQSYYQEPKPILIFLETSWCKICKMQNNTTFANDSVIRYLNETVYAFKIDAENKDSISFFNRTYHFNAAEKYHELALYFGKYENQILFPTTVILDEKQQVWFRKSALITSVELIEILQLEEEENR